LNREEELKEELAVSSRTGSGQGRPADFQDAVQAHSWDFAEAETQAFTHAIHRYSGKFIPQIASRAISLLSKPGEFVLDPYCGSGTTILEAALAGRKALGIDLNPLAVLIARAKVTPVEPQHVREATRKLRLAVEACDANAGKGLFGLTHYQEMLLDAARSDERSQDPWFTKWFQENVLFDLLILWHSVGGLEPVEVRNIALVALSEILRRSSNAHSGYPNVMYDRNAPPKAAPGPLFLKTFQRYSMMVAELPAKGVNWRDVSVIEGDARTVPLADESVDAIVTHPPYIGSIPYAEYGALSLMWLGAEPKELDSRLTGGRRQSADVVERFREGYLGMLSEALRTLRRGRYLFVMVGHPTVKGEVVNLADMTTELACVAGFELAAEATRQGVNRRANKMGDESLLFFRKPE